MRAYFRFYSIFYHCPHLSNNRKDEQNGLFYIVDSYVLPSENFQVVLSQGNLKDSNTPKNGPEHRNSIRFLGVLNSTPWFSYGYGLVGRAGVSGKSLSFCNDRESGLIWPANDGCRTYSNAKHWVAYLGKTLI